MTTRERRMAQIRNKVVKISYMALPGLKNRFDFPNAGHNKPEYIEEFICEFYGKTIHQLRTPESFRSLVKCRQIIMYFMRKYTNLSNKEIGLRFNRHHTIVIKACRVVRNLMDTEMEFKSQIETLDVILK